MLAKNSNNILALLYQEMEESPQLRPKAVVILQRYFEFFNYNIFFVFLLQYYSIYWKFEE